MNFFPLILLFAYSFAFDSRNISDTEWICGNPNERDALVINFEFVTPPGPSTIDCGTEVSQNSTSAYQSSSMPLISYPYADDTEIYTVLIVDRDASSAANPTRSPIIHMAIGGITGNTLREGFSPLTINVSSNLIFFPYSGPQPPPGSLCHRYYTILYRQDASFTPELNVSLIGRFNFNFPAWALNQSLTRLALNYWKTQSNLSRIGGCDALPSPSPPSKSGDDDDSLSKTITIVFTILVSSIILIAAQ